MERMIFIAASFVLAATLFACGESSNVSARTDSLSAELAPEAQLGKSIFFDSTLSINQNQSCASCHDPAWGWTGPSAAINAGGGVYEGSIPARFGDRKPPSAAYATPSPIFHQDKKGLFVGGNFWDGRATGEKLGNPAADQAQGPFLNPVEQALPEDDRNYAWGQVAMAAAWRHHPGRSRTAHRSGSRCPG